MEKAFRLLLAVWGIVAVVAGLITVFLGASSTVGAAEVPATIDSEMRFYAVWYVGAGALLLWSAANPARATALIRGLAALLFVGGLARGLSWMNVGQPHPFSLVLMVIELILPLVIVAWHSSLARSDT